MSQQAYTPDQVASRWGCSSNSIRSMIKRGDLRAFRLGKLYRIPVDAVKEHEECETINSSSTVESGPSIIVTEAKRAAIHAARVTAL